MKLEMKGLVGENEVSIAYRVTKKIIPCVHLYNHFSELIPHCHKMSIRQQEKSNIFKQFK